MNPIAKNALKFFNLTISTPNDKNNPTGKSFLVPGQADTNRKDGLLKPINFPSDVLRAYEYFLSNQQLYNPNRQRYELYKALLFMVRNNGIMSQALNTYITETIEMKDGQKPIQIKAKDKNVEKYFNEWIDSIGFSYNMMNELVYDIVLLGDSFLMHKIDDKEGITEVSLIDPFLIKDRIELDLNKIEEIRQWGTNNQNFVNRYNSIKQVIDYIMGENKDDTKDTYLYYKSYLLGFELKYSATDDNEKFRSLPPWSLSHFRLFTTKNEFFPFGRPMFINSLAPYQSFKTTEMLIDMLRVASFPKENVEIQGGDTLTPFDRLVRVDEVREFIENITPVTNNKNNLSIGERMYSIEGLFKYDVIESKVDMDSLGDLEKKLDDLIFSTGIPDVWLIPSRGNGGLGGENASALLYNNKIFQRRIETIKSAILEGFTNMFRLHLSITGKFKGKTTEFELFMPVNADMYSSDKIRQDGDQLRLATDFMNNISQALGMDRGEALPVKVVKDIFNYYLPVDEDRINKWITSIVKKEEEDREEGTVEKPFGGVPAPMIVPTEGADAGASADGGGAFSKKPQPKKQSPKPSKKENTENVVVKKFLEDYKNNNDDADAIIREAYFKSKKELGLTNGGLGNYIYFNNSYSSALEDDYSIYEMVQTELLLGQENKDKLED